MQKVAILGLSCLLAAAASGNEPAKRSAATVESGQVVPHIAVGDNTWSTEFQVINGEDTAQSFSLNFWDSRGVRMDLDLFDQNGVSLGRHKVFTSVVEPRGIVFLRTKNTGPLKVGYAVLGSNGFATVSVTAIITNAFAGQTSFRASVPGLADTSKNLRTAFTNTQGFSTCIAWKSGSSFEQQNITTIIRDPLGKELCRERRNLLPGEHQAFCLSDRLTCVAGRDGLVDIFADQGIAGIAFTFDPEGRFWTQIPSNIAILQ